MKRLLARRPYSLLPMKKAAWQIFNRVSNLEESRQYYHPVVEQKGYCDAVPYPLSLVDVRNRLLKRYYYITLKHFLADLRRVFENSVSFFPLDRKGVTCFLKTINTALLQLPAHIRPTPEKIPQDVVQRDLLILSAKKKLGIPLRKRKDVPLQTPEELATTAQKGHAVLASAASPQRKKRRRRKGGKIGKRKKRHKFMLKEEKEKREHNRNRRLAEEKEKAIEDITRVARNPVKRTFSNMGKRFLEKKYREVRVLDSPPRVSAEGLENSSNSWSTRICEAIYGPQVVEGWMCSMCGATNRNGVNVCSQCWHRRIRKRSTSQTAQRATNSQPMRSSSPSDSNSVRG
eukprot:CAMPEP_0167765188 /NCGR_PEP_ID=MMETSP0110_2-20121227/14524_1 /TAXON_ID=629695 /ORGANISM="Gymnochlora sp., Strain CCMP2014" /LENGTH=344 /DNA_ID=CAMNT_0007652825 /DNA_START=472 /DNA_END=1506 /DNA_ORIENTATION=-